MQSQEVKQALAEINNELYYQKLGPILSQLRDWLADKNSHVTQAYLHNAADVVDQAKNINAMLEAFTAQLLNLLSDVSQAVGFRPAETPRLKKHSSSPERDSPYSDSSRPAYLTDSHRAWASARLELEQIRANTQEIAAETGRNKEMLDKLVSEIVSTHKKIKANRPQFSDGEYVKKFSISTTKNNNKQFDIKKINEVGRLFDEECEHYGPLVLRLTQYAAKHTLAISSFQQFLSSSIAHLKQYLTSPFPALAETIETETLGFLVNLKILLIRHQTGREGQQQNLADQVRRAGHMLSQIHRQALEQICIASWPITIQKDEASQPVPSRGVITLDSKFLVVEQKQLTWNVVTDLSLRSSIIREQDDLRCISLWTKRKSAHRVIVNFCTVENSDQFRLHMQRVRSTQT